METSLSVASHCEQNDNIKAGFVRPDEAVWTMYYVDEAREEGLRWAGGVLL